MVEWIAAVETKTMTPQTWRLVSRGPAGTNRFGLSVTNSFPHTESVSSENV